MSLIIPFSEACERNKDPILSVLSSHFEKIKAVLEIGSGTGQHALHFARNCPDVTWQTSDQSQYIAGITAQLQNAGVVNAIEPAVIDVMQEDWSTGKTYDAVYTANTLHIMDWDEVIAFFKGLPHVLNSDGLLMVYGPFKYNGEFTSSSNAVFDQSLRCGGRGYKKGSAIRDFEKVNELAREQGFKFLEDHSMPANNQCLVWCRQWSC